MNKPARILTFTLSVALLAPLAALAQDGPPIYVWVNSLKANAAQGEALTAMLIEQDSENLDSLVDSGAAVNWGIAMNVVHDGNDASSHVQWISFLGWEAVDQFMQNFMASMQTATPEDRAAAAAAWEANVVAGSHSDMINRSVSIGGAPSGRPAYIHLGYYEARPGQDGAAMALWNDFAKPNFEQLATQQKIMAYGLHVPAVHRNTGWTHMSWYMTTNLAARGAVDAAFGAAGEEMSARMVETFTGEHTDQILMVVHYKEAAAE